MNIIEVNNSSSAREFILLPHSIYVNDQNWICPLHKAVEAVFDQQQNDFFQHGKCIRWILKNDTNKTIGRIAAFINFEKLNKSELPTGGIGFFECIHDKEAAFILFDTAQKWLKENGMKAMIGPINFGENDKFWGLLVEGFKPPGLWMNYNPPYYVSLFEEYGFVKDYDQLTNFLDITIPFTPRFTKIAEWQLKRPGYSFEHFKINSFKKYAKDFQEVYNDAWEDFENFTPINSGTIHETFLQMKPIMNEKFIWFAYHQQKPIAFLLCLPDVNQILKHLNGRLNLLGKLKFFWYKKNNSIDRLRIVIMGCKKQYQHHGIESTLTRKLQLEVEKFPHIKGVELAWVGDFNEKMIAIHNAAGAIKDKVHRTYMYVFPN